MSFLELVAAAIGVLAVYLTIRQNRWCWPLGLITVVIYSWLFYESKLYSNVLLQGVYALLQGYGWWLWTQGGEHHDGVKITKLSTQSVLSNLLIGATGACLLGALMSHFTDATAPWQDAALSAFSLVGQVWMAQKRLQCWSLWVVLDSLYVALFIQQELYLTAALYALFTALALNGWLSWHRQYRALCQ